MSLQLIASHTPIHDYHIDLGQIVLYSLAVKYQLFMMHAIVMKHVDKQTYDT